jgi:hypothetical protein
MKRTGFPPGWNYARVQRVLEHYERQNQDEAVAEDEAAFRSRTQTVMVVPKRLVPAITRLIERQGTHRQIASRRSNKALQPPSHKPRRG